jgi:putative ABC transport system permease protein
MLEQSLSFNVLRDPLLLVEILAAAFVIAVLGGLYPALVLSSFRPSVALRGGPEGIGSQATVRQVMVVAQYAILVGLVVATVTIYRQTSLALDKNLSAGRGPVLLLVMRCDDNIVEQARSLPGVKAATCSSGGAMNFTPQGAITVISQSGARLTPGFVEADSWFFGMFGIKPLAGRTFAHGSRADAAQHRIVINEAAARDFGFASPKSAVGQSIRLSLEVGDAPKLESVEIIGVVPDRPASVLAPTGALIYNNWFGGGVLAVNSTAENQPLMRDSLKRLWMRLMAGDPFATNSLEQFERDRYRGIILQGMVIASCAVLALIIAAMGLFALTTFMTEQRTREIGVRKAMGAGVGDIMGLLFWQFTRPVLVAAIIALPISDLLMKRWLEQFAMRVDLPIWLGAAALAGALGIALLTVGVQVVAAARARPARSLRYE